MLSTIAESNFNVSKELLDIQEKVYNNERITNEEGLLLFQKGSLPFLGSLANYIREKKHGDITYFNRNFHIEPTNVCVFTCNFCSYCRLYAHREEGWELSAEQMLHMVKKYDGQAGDRSAYSWRGASENES